MAGCETNAIPVRLTCSPVRLTLQPCETNAMAIRMRPAESIPATVDADRPAPVSSPTELKKRPRKPGGFDRVAYQRDSMRRYRAAKSSRSVPPT